MASARPAVERDDSALSRLIELAQAEGDISDQVDEQTLSTIGADVVRDYERDLRDRAPWERIVRKALATAAQEERAQRDTPWPGASNAEYPILTVAAQQFNARAYPAICKSGSMVKAKVIGSDKGRPVIDPATGQPAMQPAGEPGPVDPETGMPTPPPMAPVWQIPPGAKAKRAARVSEYLNVYLEYRMDDWESDTDLMLYQIAIVGCGFRKMWWRDGKQRSAYVPALDFVVPASAKSLKTTPRATERIPDVYPYQIRQRMAAGEYRQVELPTVDDDLEAPRLLLEQQRYIDLDDDGVDEPYIVTADYQTSQVLRIEPNFSLDDVKMQDERVVRIDRPCYYVKYPFLPNPSGSFYDIGFGHLLDQVGGFINDALNAMFDEAFARVAGGGFLASGVRLQSNGQTNVIRMRPGEYRTVSVSGQSLREGIFERTFPNHSPAMFNLLELMLGAAKDITSVKDVVTGEAPNTAPVGTTLALIEQGLQVFTAIYKRIYLALGQEFSATASNLARFGGDEVARDYAEVLDDPEADFARDFAERDMDIKPVADPTSVTNAQKIAKAQVLLSFRGQGLNDLEIDRRALEALNIDDIDALLPDPNAPPAPQVMAAMARDQSETDVNAARASLYHAQATEKAVRVGMAMGGADAR